MYKIDQITLKRYYKFTTVKSYHLENKLLLYPAISEALKKIILKCYHIVSRIKQTIGNDKYFNLLHCRLRNPVSVCCGCIAFFKINPPRRNTDFLMKKPYERKIELLWPMQSKLSVRSNKLKNFKNVLCYIKIGRRKT